MIQHFEGVCDVCGEKMAYEYDTASGIVDSYFTDEGRWYIFIKHGHGGYDDWCRTERGAIFSPVFEVPWPKEAE